MRSIIDRVNEFNRRDQTVGFVKSIASLVNSRRQCQNHSLALSSLCLIPTFQMFVLK